MSTSRRDVLLQGAVVGAGIIAAGVPGIEALAQGGPKLRRSLTGMAPNDPILSTWREGVGLMKARSGNVSWASFAAIHGTAAGFNRCPHGNWYFLPWHRAFLVSYERVVRDLTGNADFALPYWDWTNDRRLPPAFTSATFNGRPNPLFEPSRTMRPTDSLTDEIVGQGVLDQILQESPYETFATSRPDGQDSLDPSWISTRTGVQGTLESTPHNNVHNRVGGVMRSSQSALDPIFMMHHCNIDRIWWLWNQSPQPNSTDPLWTDMAFRDHYLNPDGSTWSPKVSDLFTPETLGYTYSPQPISVPAEQPSAAVVAQNDRFRSLFAARAAATTGAATPVGGVASFTAPVAQPATAARAASIAIAIDSSVLSAVARRPALPSGGAAAALSLGRARSQIASGPRAYAFIRDIAYTQEGDTLFRVFLDRDELNAETPVTDPHYVGTFAFFGPPHGHGHGGTGPGATEGPSIGIDLTAAIKRVYGPRSDIPGRIVLQIQPVPNETGREAGTAKPSRVEVAIVSA